MTQQFIKTTARHFAHPPKPAPAPRKRPASRCTAACLAMVAQAGITLPVMYALGYQHNNCIGCAKATGAGYWNKIRADFPYEFDRMAALSRKLGARMTREGERRIFLDELKPGTGDYQAEPEIQCGIFCEMAQKEYEVPA